MHQSIILTAPSATDINEHLDKLLPKSRSITYIEDHIKEKGKTRGIFIEDIRDLRDSIKTSGFGEATRAIVFRDAALMTTQAQNAFLKHLEEPDPKTVFVLVTPNPTQLLETVRSRCVLIEVPNQTAESSNPQITFMSRGESAEVNKLTKNKRYLEKRISVYSKAKLMVGGSQFDKLKLITEISSDRAASLEVISAALHIIQVQLKSRYNPALVGQAERLMVGYKRIEGNGNVRLQLLDSMI